MGCLTTGTPQVCTEYRQSLPYVWEVPVHQLTAEVPVVRFFRSSADTLRIVQHADTL